MADAVPRVCAYTDTRARAGRRPPRDAMWISAVLCVLWPHPPIPQPASLPPAVPPTSVGEVGVLGEKFSRRFVRFWLYFICGVCPVFSISRDFPGILIVLILKTSGMG